MARSTIPQQQNLQSYSEQLSSGFSPHAISFASDVTAAPNGTMTADKIVVDNTNAQHYASGAGLVSLLTNTYTISGYFKAAEYSTFLISVSGGGVYSTYNLLTGTFTPAGGGTGGMQNVGNGWWRCWLTTPASLPYGLSVYIFLQSGGAFLGDGTSGLYAWGLQVVGANWPGPYTQTTAAAVNNGNIRSLAGSRLAAAQNQNILTYSQDFTNAVWTTTNATTAQNQALAPDGTQTAGTITDNVTNAGHNTVQSVPGTIAGKIATFSVYAKQGTGQWLGVFANSNGVGRYFNLQTGQIGVGGGGAALISQSITPVNNGFYRCSITYIANGSPCSIYMASADGVVTYAGSGQYNYIWGAQLVIASWAGGYIRTNATGINPTSNIRNLSAAIRPPIDVPSSLSGLAFWVRADQGLILDTSGGVSVWNDLSGNQKNISRAVSVGRPTVVQNWAGGSPALRTDGSGATMYSTDQYTWPIDAVTVFAVLATNANTTTGDYFSQNQGGGDFPYHFYSSAAGNFKRWSGGTNVTITPLTPTILHYTGAGVNEEVFKNGVSQGTTAVRPAVTNRQMFIWGSGTADQNKIGYDLAELIVFGRVLTVPEQTLVKTYLSNRYKITVT